MLRCTRRPPPRARCSAHLTGESPCSFATLSGANTRHGSCPAGWDFFREATLHRYYKKKSPCTQTHICALAHTVMTTVGAQGSACHLHSPFAADAPSISGRAGAPDLTLRSGAAGPQVHCGRARRKQGCRTCGSARSGPRSCRGAHRGAAAGLHRAAWARPERQPAQFVVGGGQPDVQEPGRCVRGANLLVDCGTVSCNYPLCSLLLVDDIETQQSGTRKLCTGCGKDLLTSMHCCRTVISSITGTCLRA